MSRKPRPSKKVVSPAPEARPVPPAAGFWRLHGWRIAVLWTITLMAYSNSFQTALVFDNRPLILEDARVHAVTAQNLDRILTGDYWPDREASGLYRPVTTLSYLFNYALLGNGQIPAGYHVLNSVIHGVNVSLVYALGLIIFAAPMPAFALAAMWGLHPLLTEAVTNVIGRADLLAGFGVLAGLLCYFKGQSAQGHRTSIWIAGLAIAQGVGIFSKENAAILIGLMLLSDFVLPDRAPVRGRVPFYAAAGVLCAVYLFIRVQSHPRMEVLFTDNPLVGTGFWTARLTAIGILGKYIWLFLWPTSLSADYSFNAIPIFSWRLTDWEDIKTILALLVCAAAILGAFRWRRSQGPLFFFVVFFFLALLPTANLAILIGSIMAERFAYLALIGLAGCLVIAIQALSRKWGAPAWITAGLVCAGFAGRTYARNFDWQDDSTLWTSAVEVCPQSAKAHLNLGRVFLETPGRLPDAISEYETALRIEPGYALAHYSLATALSKTPGRTASAIEHYRAALRSEPDYAEAHNNLGNALAQAQQVPEAIAEFRAAIRIHPNYAEAHNNLGDALSSLPGRQSEAIAEYQAALRIDPNLAAAHYNLASSLAEMPGRLEEAIAEFRLAIQAQPDFVVAHNNLGIALAQSGRLAEAVVEFNAAIQLNPSYADAHVNLGRAFLQIPGRSQDAIREFETAMRIHPDPGLERDIQHIRMQGK